MSLSPGSGAGYAVASYAGAADTAWQAAIAHLRIRLHEGRVGERPTVRRRSH